MDEEGRIKIRFELTDEFDDNYVSESNVEVFHSLEETDVDVIGRQFNVFLKQCGYHRPNDLIFMESVTEEEYDAIADFLADLRNGRADENDD